MHLQQHFKSMMAKAWPDVKPSTPQWQDLENAFMGGALVCYGKMLGCTSEADLQRLEHEVRAHGEMTSTRAAIFESILSAGS
jgi:hypothetical protein